MDFVQSLDPAKLVLLQTALSFLTSPFTAPVYNLPIALFGVYTVENTEHALANQVFTGLTGLSVLADLIYMTRHEQNGLVKMFTIAIMILKVPVCLVFVNLARQAGGGIGNLGIRGGDLSGPTVWSMPGGFTSGGRDGYQSVDEESGVRVPQPTAAAPPGPPPVPHGPTSLSHPPAAPGSYQGA